MENMRFWKTFNRPPAEVLKEIKAGRLKGKSDINPLWRVQAMTETFGPVGMGWKYTIDKLWREQGDGCEVFAFCQISVYVMIDGKWSDAIPGIGGSMLVESESKGPHNNDEGYKMALTDALSVAMKALGVAADVYMGLWDGSKYMKADITKIDPQTSEIWMQNFENKVNNAKVFDELTALYTSLMEGEKEGHIHHKQFETGVSWLSGKKQVLNKEKGNG